MLKSLGYFIAIGLILATAAAEILFWDEFQHRFNFIAVDYLVYTHEILGTIYESWPIYKIIFTTVAIDIIIILIYRKSIFSPKKQSSRLGLFVKAIFNLILVALSFAYYNPDYFKQSNNYANELAKNGYYELFSAFRKNYINYPTFYPTINEEEALKLVRENIKQSNQTFLNSTHLVRDTSSSNEHEHKYNIIFITVESLSAEFMHAFGNQENITPHLDALAKESIFFTNFYATGTRTVRGLEALTLSIPPTPGSAILRRENNENLFNLGAVLNYKGYYSAFIYGGYSYFDNMKYFFEHNGYEVIDRGDFESDEKTFGNVWGTCDEDLFNKSLKIVNNKYKTNEPFFLFLMTTSNHRPYTFPENKIDLPSGTRAAAVKYTDYAIYKFISEAKKQPWFDNTIFVIVADHCASTAGSTALPQEKYHIPLLIYAPKIVHPKVVATLSGQIDVAPTILGLNGMSYRSEFFGQDIFDANFKPKAFISTYQLLGYVSSDKLTILEPNKKNIPLDKDALEAISFYQVSSKWFKEKQLQNQAPE
jgi:phosphoglycerol transferase MdoB-like AlkP superfamily enzyme